MLDTKSTGGHMVLVIRRLRELIAQGLSFEEVAREIVEYNREVRLLFTLSTFRRGVPFPAAPGGTAPQGGCCSGRQ